MNKKLLNFLLFTLTVIVLLSTFSSSFLWLIVLEVFIIAIWMYDMKQTSHSLWRNYPVVGRFRWLLEELRPPIRQYFIESDIDGVPFNRQTRGLVYRRSKNIENNIPFGT